MLFGVVLLVSRAESVGNIIQVTPEFSCKCTFMMSEQRSNKNFHTLQSSTVLSFSLCDLGPEKITGNNADFILENANDKISVPFFNQSMTQTSQNSDLSGLQPSQA